MFMTIEEKEEIIMSYNDMFYFQCRKYNNMIWDLDFEELVQEIRTHVSDKLDDYDSSKSSVSTFVYMVTRNKLENMRKYLQRRRNVEPQPLDNLEEDLIDVILENYDGITVREKEILEIAFDMVEDEDNKNIIMDFIKTGDKVAVGKKYGLSRQRVYQIIKKFGEKVKEEL